MPTVKEIEDSLTSGPDPGQIPAELQEKYRRVLSNPMGQEVLADMLCNLGLFATLNHNPEETTRHNTAVELLAWAGILKPDSSGRLDIKDVKKIVSALLSITE